MPIMPSQNPLNFICSMCFVGDKNDGEFIYAELVILYSLIQIAHSLITSCMTVSMLHQYCSADNFNTINNYLSVKKM